MPDNTALGHLKIIDMSRILAGPWASQTLADLGADVIKIENPDGGDDTRRWGPPFVTSPDGEPGDAAYYTAANRNKRSIAIDFRRDDGLTLIKNLVRDADVVIENYKVGGLAKYGLDYESLKAIKPDLVYCSITGFGQIGPYAHRPGYDFLLQAMGGLMSITGHPDSDANAAEAHDGAGGPVKVGVAVCDLFTGMYAATSILAALAHRDRSGEGQHIDLALMDGQIAMLANQGANWLVGNTVPGRMGNKHPNLVPYNAFPTRDGHIIIACGNDRQFQRLCDALGAEHLCEDERFASNADRIANREALEESIGALSAALSRQQVIETLEAAGIPCGPINNIDDVFEGEHAKSHALEVSQKRPDGVQVSTIAFPARLSATPATYRHAPPVLGSDTDQILEKELGLTPDEISRLRELKTIG